MAPSFVEEVESRKLDKRVYLFWRHSSVTQDLVENWASFEKFGNKQYIILDKNANHVGDLLQQTVKGGKTLQKAGKVKGLGMFPRNSLEDTTYNMVSTMLVMKALVLLAILLGDPAMELGFVSNGSSIQSP